jgi:hypothetical protein
VFQFVIDSNPQSLKDTRGRVSGDGNSVMPLRAAGLSDSNGRDQIGGRPVRDVRPPRDDGSSNRAAGPLFAKLLKQLGQRIFVERGEQLRRSRASGRIKSHVECRAARRLVGRTM